MQGQAPTTSLKITGASQVSSRVVSVTQGPFNPPIQSATVSIVAYIRDGIGAYLIRGFVEEIVGHHARLPLDRRTL